MSQVTKIQAITGALFALFLTPHLLMHILVTHYGEAEYNQTLLFIRKFYQNPIIEVSIILLAVIHMVSGVISFWNRQSIKSNIKYPMLHNLHKWSGWFIMVVFFGHFVGGRVLPLLYDIKVDFSYISFPLTNKTARKIFLPYYTLLGLTGTIHLLVGLLKAANRLGLYRNTVTLPKTKSVGALKIWNAVVAVFCILMIVGLMNYMGVFYKIDETRFPEYISKYATIGVDLS